MGRALTRRLDSECKLWRNASGQNDSSQNVYGLSDEVAIRRAPQSSSVWDYSISPPIYQSSTLADPSKTSRIQGLEAAWIDSEIPGSKLQG